MSMSENNIFKISITCDMTNCQITNIMKSNTMHIYMLKKRENSFILFARYVEQSSIKSSKNLIINTYIFYFISLNIEVV